MPLCHGALGTDSNGITWKEDPHFAQKYMSGGIQAGPRELINVKDQHQKNDICLRLEAIYPASPSAAKKIATCSWLLNYGYPAA